MQRSFHNHSSRASSLSGTLVGAGLAVTSHKSECGTGWAHSHNHISLCSGEQRGVVSPLRRRHDSWHHSQVRLTQSCSLKILWKSGCGLVCQMSFSPLEQRWVYTIGCKGVQFTVDREEVTASFHHHWIPVWRWEDLGLDPTFSFTAGQSLTMQMPHLLYEHDLQKPNLIFFFYWEYFDQGGRGLEHHVLARVIGKYLNQS